MNPGTTLHEDPAPQEVDEMYDFLVDHLNRGGTQADLRGITDEECEALYTLGYGLYQKGAYGEARKILAYLVLLNHTEYRYVMALASASQAIGKFEDALAQYASASVLDPLEPAAPFHCALCLVEMGQPDAALQSLDLAVTMCHARGADKHSALLERAKAMQAAIQMQSKEIKP